MSVLLVLSSFLARPDPTRPDPTTDFAENPNRLPTRYDQFGVGMMIRYRDSVGMSVSVGNAHP